MKQTLLVLSCTAFLISCQSKLAFEAHPEVLNNGISPLLCSAGSPSEVVKIYPTNCLVPQGLAADSLGLQVNNVYHISDSGPDKVFSITANDPVVGTPSTRTLYVELATYGAPDTFVIRSVDREGNETEILNICSLSTSNFVDPTDGTFRPHSTTLLQFHITLPAHTTRLIFDYSGSTSPTYMGVWNLNEFSNSIGTPSTNPFRSIGKESHFRPMNGPLSVYNDNQDPNQSPTYCPGI